MRVELALPLALAAPLAVAAAAGCMMDGAYDAAHVSTDEVPTAPTMEYADVEYDEDYSSSPTRNDPRALTPWNDGDPERPAGFPKTFLYDESSASASACSNVYDLYAAPALVAPRWAHENGCRDSDGDRAEAVTDFLNAHLPGHAFQSTWTPASWTAAEAGGDTDAPAWSWEIVTTLIDARKPFVAATAWRAPRAEADVDHLVTVADYAVRDGRRYVLLVNYGHYKWYPYLDKDSGPKRRTGFHSRWQRGLRGVALGQKYFRIRPDAPVPPDVWARWHTR